MGVDAVLVLGVRHHKQLVRCRRPPPAPGGVQRREGLWERLEMTAQVQPGERDARILQDVGVLLLRTSGWDHWGAIEKRLDSMHCSKFKRSQQGWIRAIA